MDDTTLQLIQNYQVPETVIERLQQVQAVILTGITGAGKDTIIQDILQESDRFTKVITSTTRDPRENNGVMEQNEVDYYFFSGDEAVENVKNGEYIEVANVHGKIYGSLVREYERISADGNIALTTIDYQGATNFLNFNMPKLLVLFIVPPSFDVWLERLAGRSGGSLNMEKDEIISRFRSAEKELAHALNDPRFVPVMNVESAETAKQIIKFASEGSRPTDQEISEAHKVIRELSQSITDYITQVEE